MSNARKSKRTKAARRARRPAQSTAPVTPKAPTSESGEAAGPVEPEDLVASSASAAEGEADPVEEPTDLEEQAQDSTPQAEQRAGEDDLVEEPIETAEDPAPDSTPQAEQPAGEADPVEEPTDLEEQAPDSTPQAEQPAGEADPVEEPVKDSSEADSVQEPTETADDPVEVEDPVQDSTPQKESAASDESGGESAPVDAHRSWRRLGRAARPRPTKANVLATVLALSLGFAIAAQVRQTSIEGLEDLREDELIRILDTVNQDGSRLADELQTLRFSRDRLKNDTTSLTEQRNAAQQRLDSLGILAGTVAAQGPGIILTINDPQNRVTAPLLLDTLQELRDAGAEAIEINGVRIVASSYFTDGEGGIEISGTAVSGPYVVRAIGDPATLAPAMDIPGGVSESVRAIDGQARIESRDEVKVTALRSVSEPQYARPVPSPSKS